ncbi:hypothetical protein D3C71_1402660 [compost metagenome]
MLGSKPSKQSFGFHAIAGAQVDHGLHRPDMARDVLAMTLENLRFAPRGVVLGQLGDCGEQR